MEHNWQSVLIREGVPLSGVTFMRGFYLQNKTADIMIEYVRVETFITAKLNLLGCSAKPMGLMSEFDHFHQIGNDQLLFLALIGHCTYNRPLLFLQQA